MASTVPGVDQGSKAVKLSIGVQAPDLTGLAAPTISLAPGGPMAPGGKLGQLRRSGEADRARDASPTNKGGDSFAAALAKAVAARKAANDAASRANATRQPRVDAKQEREAAVRDVVRQLKQLVDTARETRASNGTPPKQSGQATSTRGGEVNAAALSGAFERLAGTDTSTTSPATVSDELSSQQQADVAALLQTVAEVLAQAMTPDGEIDEAALAAALLSDPLALAAAEALIAALQAQLVTATPVALPATQTDGEAIVGEGTGSSSSEAGLHAAPLGEAHASQGARVTSSVTFPTTSTTAEALDAPAAVATGEGAVTPVVATQSTQAGSVAEAEAIVVAVETTSAGEGAATPALSAQPTGQAAPSAVSPTIDNMDVAAEAAEIVESTKGAPSTGAAAAETASLPSAASTAALDSEVVAVSVTESVETPAPTSGEQVATILTQPSGGQSGAESDAQNPGEGGNAFFAGAAVANAAAAAAGSTGDVDGVASGQPAHSASGVQGSGSSASAGANAPTSTPTSTGTTPAAQGPTAGSTAPAARTEVVAQPQGATDSTPDTELHEQVSPVIVRQARLISGTGPNGGHELTVRLNPDHLGPLHVRISLVEGALSVGLTTANAEAQRALENALPQLRGALVESGLRLERLDVNQRDAGSGGNGQSGGQRGSANAGRDGGQFGQSGQAGYTGNEGRQANAGSNGGTSFADVLLDQDGRAFGPSGSTNRGARWLGYRAYRRA